MRLDRYIDDLLAAEDLRASTLATYASVLKTHINPALGKRDIEDIGPADVRSFFGDLRRSGVGEGAIDMVYRLLSKAFHAALAEETITKTPMKAVKRAKASRSKIKPPTPDELRGIIDNIAPYYKAMTEIMAWDALRIGEAAALEVTTWDPDTGRIRIDKQSSRFGYGEDLKTEAAYREIILPPRINALLKWHVKKYPPIDGRLFSTRLNNPITSDSYYTAFRTACRRAGITRPLSPHKLRHHALSAMARAGVPPKVAQGHAGHTTAALTLDVYTHINDDDLLDTSHRMEEASTYVPEQRADEAVPVG